MPKQKTKDNCIDKDLLVDAFKALSNRNRLAIFEQIRMGCAKAGLDGDSRLAVCSVAESVNIVPSTISHHVKELRRAHLIRCERQGQSIL
ncbi:MAG TPA: metalloregulator ArsR/SmtB family transcription factor [Desulfomonilia bacterium]|nr:metalloregulator ArsR/SmtB family transcription factor [Desulfomonilia bacterium]